ALLVRAGRRPRGRPTIPLPSQWGRMDQYAPSLDVRPPARVALTGGAGSARDARTCPRADLAGDRPAVGGRGGGVRADDHPCTNRASSQEFGAPAHIRPLDVTR